uniref:Uncharacterized protein n=1 Tax=Panagrolaimus superbus TaxID=310955 RepID=A0A914YC86_9BILA
MSDTLMSTFNRIDDGILETFEKDFLPDNAAYKTKHEFPKSFINENVAALTFDSHFVKEKSINDVQFDVSNHVESSIRPTTKCFAPLDESIMRNSYYDHSAGFKDYDKLAKRKRKPDFLYYGLVPKGLFRDIISTFEPLQKSETDMKKLILEFKEFLAQPDNIPWQLNYEYATDKIVEDDGWDIKQLDQINNLRKVFLDDRCAENKELNFVFQGLASKLKVDAEGMCSIIKDDFHGGINFLNAVAPLDPEKLNPYLCSPLTQKYTAPANVPREPCSAIYPLHPGRKILTPKLMATPEIKEVKSGLPFELKPPRLPFECPRVVQEYTNHLVIRIALNRYIFNNDDSFAHFILYKLLDARPDTFYAQEAFRILIYPARSMSHKEIQTLVKIANDYQCFDASLHYLLAMDYFREKNFNGMEEEISNWCFSLRYFAMNKFYHPFPETAETEKSTFKENNESVFSGERKSIVLTSCLYLLALNYQKTREHLKQLRMPDYEDEELLHWAFSLDAQAQIGQVNPYAQRAITFFDKSSDFFHMSSFETMQDLETLVDYFKTRLDNAKDGDSAIPEVVKELNFRFLMIQYIHLQHHTLSSKEHHVKGIHEIYKSLSSVPYYESKTRKLERLTKTLMRSYYLSIGKKGCGPQLSLVPEPQLTGDSHEGYTVEGTIIDNILNAYEMAYAGKFDVALNVIDKLESANMNGVVGYHNITIAKSCIKYDKSFFENTRAVCDKNLSTLHEACPLEALFRDIPYQILYGEINISMIRRLYQVLGRSKSIEVLPSTQIRCYIALAQIFIELEKYRNAIDELSKALELSTKLNLLLFVSMINRRLAIVYTCMNEIPEAYKLLEKCKVAQLNVNIPSLEAGMIYFTKYIIHRKANQLGNVKGIQILPDYALIEYLTKATKLLKPFTLIYKWLLVEEFDFLLSRFSHTHSGPYKSPSDEAEAIFVRRHKEDFEERFSHEFDLKNFSFGLSSSDWTKMATEHKRMYSLPIHLI